MTTINIDGQDYEVHEGDNLLSACLSHGLDLPYFCWHPAMDSVGACRQCAVVKYRDEEDQQGSLTMACMTPAKDGDRIAISAPNAVDFRASVIEWLMENHPHDCPVCEEGGECHLQDMTVMTGHATRRYRGLKRTFENQYLGPHINHEMNRCITCYRCVRFYQDYAGGTDLAAFGSRSRMYFGRAEPGVLESEFSGNLIEVCPTGVFTDKPFSETYTRKWDLQSAPVVCTGCSVGCNLHASERYGQLKRIHNRYHPELNRYFICDRGRFGMGYVNSASRIRHTGERIGESLFRQIEPQTAITQVAGMLANGSVIGIGSPRASLEDNAALRMLVGADNFSPGLDTREAACLDAAVATGLNSPSLATMESADVVLILGEDLLNTAPRVALALRQATRNVSYDMAQDAGIPLWQDAGVRGHAQDAVNSVYSATMLPTRLDDIATDTCYASPDDLVRTATAIASALEGIGGGTSDPFQANVIDALRGAKQPLIVTGMTCASPELINAAARITRALDDGDRTPNLAITANEANSFGVHRLGGLNLEQVLDTAARGEVKTLVIAANDLFRRASKEQVTKAISAVDHIIVLDSLDNATADRADLVLPAATVIESSGTLVNYEGRAQLSYQVFQPVDDIRPIWQWITAVAETIGRNECVWQTANDVRKDLAKVDGFGQLLELDGETTRTGRPIPRQSHRYSGRTAMYANETMHEPKAAEDIDSPFAYSMEGAGVDEGPAAMPYTWSPGWNSNQSVFKFQHEVGGALRGGHPGTLLAPVATLAATPASASFASAPLAS
ncbi:MAG: NADH-quinone oxidoreductase subunit G, partial [Limisphaerales bacterium]